jgi:hypothetical protein
MRLKESRRVPLYNGAIECRLFRFDLVAGAGPSRGSGKRKRKRQRLNRPRAQRSSGSEPTRCSMSAMTAS